MWNPPEQTITLEMVGSASASSTLLVDNYKALYITFVQRECLTLFVASIPPDNVAILIRTPVCYGRMGKKLTLSAESGTLGVHENIFSIFNKEIVIWQQVRMTREK